MRYGPEFYLTPAPVGLEAQGRGGFMKENDIGTVVVDAALQIHRELGPGLLESVYEAILAYELRERGLYVERQVVVSMNYKGLNFDSCFWALPFVLMIFTNRNIFCKTKHFQKIGLLNQ